jgi:serine O-acetyltransferase
MVRDASPRSSLGALLRADAARLERRPVSGADLVRLAITAPPFNAALLHRLGHRLGSRRAGLGRLCNRLNLVLNGADIDFRADIGPGLLLQHPVGTVLGACTIGANATLMSGVVLGRRDVLEGPDAGQYPVVGDDVLFGAHATALGPVQIGDGARIGAHALVLSDVPACAVAVGVPARAIGSAQTLQQE